ncbi:MAG: TonB-dependent receptor [Bacteroidetes bacterium]|nr:TonB-dependent receptor [Bacteroidota bacterium]MBL6943631.1 TonB-dependent receptor [Bacteroidales bacterium]
MRFYAFTRYNTRLADGQKEGYYKGLKISRLIHVHKFLFVLLCISFLSNATSQNNGIFSGRITDKETSGSLIGANVYLKKDMSLGTVSDFNGYFSLTVPPGTYVFSVSYTGMKTQSFQINVSSDSTTHINMEMIPFSTDFDEIIVRAGKFDKSVENQTVSIEIMSSRLIEVRNTESVETILNMVPGLTILDEEPQIRGGSGFTFGVGSKVAVFIDNLPVTSGDAGKTNWSLIPVENIKQIEVVKGASSVLSGASALSGAIYIRTNYPGIQPETKIKIFGGFNSSPRSPALKWWNGINYNTGASFLHSQQLGNGQTDLVIGGMFSANSSYLGAPVTGPFVVDTVPITDDEMANRKARLNFNLRHRSKKIKGLDFGVNGNIMYHKSSTVFAWLDDTSNFYRAYPGAVLLSNNTTFYLDPFVNFYSGMGIKHEFTSRIMFSNNDANNNQSTQSLFVYNNYQFGKSFKNLGNLDFIIGATNQYTYSYAHLYEASGSPSNYLWNTSVFMEVEKKFGTILNISAGARLENYQINDTIRDSKPIIRVGASLKLGQETYLRASVGQGYRFPTITERYIKTTVGSFGVFDNPELIPETSWNSEIGVKQGFKFVNYYGYFDVALFYQEYSNTIEYLFGFWDSTYSFAIAGFKFVNTGKSKVTGIDISLTGQAKVTDNFTFNTLFGYTYILPVTLQPSYVFAKDYNPGGSKDFSYKTTSVNPSRNILKYRFLHTLKLDIELNYFRFSAGFSLKYFSKMENLDKAIFDFEDATVASGGTTQPILYRKYYETHNNGNVVIDGRIGYKIGIRHKISLISTNMLNKMYSLRPLKAEPMRNISLQYILNL